MAGKWSSVHRASWHHQLWHHLDCLMLPFLSPFFIFTSFLFFSLFSLYSFAHVCKKEHSPIFLLDDLCPGNMDHNFNVCAKYFALYGQMHCHHFMQKRRQSKKQIWACFSSDKVEIFKDNFTYLVSCLYIFLHLSFDNSLFYSVFTQFLSPLHSQPLSSWFISSFSHHNIIIY